jgi:spermidine synthase
MIDQYVPGEAVPPAAPLPMRAGPARGLVLATVFVCAACGLVYELELVAVASFLLDDPVTQTSIVLSVMVFAMGVGSLLAKRLRGVAAAGFGAVEAVLAAVGGLSAMALHASFAWVGQPVAAMVGFALAIGVLVGAEVPLLMTLIQRIHRQEVCEAVADIFAADYVGALVGGLAFPFLLLPLLGQLDAVLVAGAVNTAAGGALILWLFRDDLSARSRGRLLAANLAVLAVLAGAAASTGTFERAARQAVYGGDVLLAERTAVQEVVLTRAPQRLYLDGRLQDPALEGPLVRPAMDGRPRHRRVLILGGAEGLALGEVLRYPGVRSVSVVDPDAELLRLARTNPRLAALNRHAYRDGRVHAVAADPFRWLRRGRARPDGYDLIIAEVPEPGRVGGAKLRSTEFYGLAARSLAAGGRLALRGGTVAGDGRQGTVAFWTLDATVRAAGLRTAAYRMDGHGYLLARLSTGHPAAPAAVRLPPGALRLVGPRRELPPSTLTHPRL